MTVLRFASVSLIALLGIAALAMPNTAATSAASVARCTSNDWLEPVATLERPVVTTRLAHMFAIMLRRDVPGIAWVHGEGAASTLPVAEKIGARTVVTDGRVYDLYLFQATAPGTVKIPFIAYRPHGFGGAVPSDKRAVFGVTVALASADGC